MRLTTCRQPHCACPHGRRGTSPSGARRRSPITSSGAVAGPGPAAEQVRVISRSRGAFRGKSDPSAGVLRGKLAMKTGRPVKILYTREESLRDRRAPSDEDGRDVALDGRAHRRRGQQDPDRRRAYASFGLVTAYYAASSSRAYRSHLPIRRYACTPTSRLWSKRAGFGAAALRLRGGVGRGGGEAEGWIRSRCAGELQWGVRGDGERAEDHLERVLKCLSWWRRPRVERPARQLGPGGAWASRSMYISGTAYPVYPQIRQSGVLVKLDRSGRVWSTAALPTSARASTRCSARSRGGDARDRAT